MNTAADTQEVAAGAAKDQLEGWIPDLASPEELRQALEKAFDYRGDITITLRNGAKLEGYLFDRRSGQTLETSIVRILLKQSSEKVSVPYSDIASLAFTGRDTAAGKSWEAWLWKYWEKRAAGETGIALQPEDLNDSTG
jgi:hypothetical protein